MAGIFGYTWKMRWIIIVQNVAIIIGFIAFGLWLDQKFHTKPVFTILGLILSFIVNQFVSIQVINRLVKGKEQYNPADPKNMPEKSESTIV